MSQRACGLVASGLLLGSIVVVASLSGSRGPADVAASAGLFVCRVLTRWASLLVEATPWSSRPRQAGWFWIGAPGGRQGPVRRIWICADRANSAAVRAIERY